MAHIIEDCTYKVKCRACGKITITNLFPTGINTKEDVKNWSYNRSNIPVALPCTCDTESIIFHDVISFSLTIFKQ